MSLYIHHITWLSYHLAHNRVFLRVNESRLRGMRVVGRGSLKEREVGKFLLKLESFAEV